MIVSTTMSSIAEMSIPTPPARIGGMIRRMGLRIGSVIIPSARTNLPKFDQGLAGIQVARIRTMRMMTYQWMIVATMDTSALSHH